MLREGGKQLCWKCLLLLSSAVTTYTLDINIDSLSRVLPGHSSNQDGAITQWFSKITKEYRKTASQSTSLVNFDLSELSKNTSDLLTTRLFQPRRKALESTVLKTQEFAANFDWSQPIADDTSYHDSNKFEDNDYLKDVENEGEGRFKKHVNFTFSSVFIPVERYSKEPDLLVNLNWTSKLDEYFRENYKKSTQTNDYDDYLWQYFGSESGFVRSYPASQWPAPSGSEVDMYDARRRPWYNQGSTTHKDVLIMMDTSGSTVGQTLYLMQVTVQKILDSLGEDDYFQVANFSNYKYMEQSGWDPQLRPPSFYSFLQATEFNRRHVMNYVNNITKPEYQANYTLALEYAFKSFDELEKERERLNNDLSADCAKIIIILTDGGIEKPEVLIYKNDPNKDKYRIFTFAMGQHPTPLDAVRWLACNQGGYFTRISKIGTVYAGVQKYTRHLSRILAGAISSPNEQLPSSLSTAYKDDWLVKYAAPYRMAGSLHWSYPDPQRGLGMMTSLTMPVINVTDPTRQNVLGVMAIDISLEEFDQYIQFYKLGGLGYIVVVNHNGHLIRHPDLVDQEEWDVLPPTVDIIDIERVTDQSGYNDVDKVRTAMIEERKDTFDVNKAGEVYNNAENPAYYEEYSKVFQTVKISETAYSLALVVPRDKFKYLQMNSTNKTRLEVASSVADVLSGLVDQIYTVSVAPWGYCNKIYSISNRNNQSTNIAEFKKIIENLTITCDEELINHFLMDAEIVNSLQLLKLVKTEQNVLSVSISTAAGFSAVYPNTTSPDYHFQIYDALKEPARKRALHHTDEILYIPTYSKSAVEIPVNGSHPPIFLYKSITDNSDYNYVYSVVSVKIESSEIIESLAALTDNNNNYLCRGDDYQCYLLDGGGFVVAKSQTNNDTQLTSDIGRWVGDVDPSLMYALYNVSNPSNSIYKQHKFIDYQARCIKSWSNLPTSAGHIFKLSNILSLFESVLLQITTFISLFSSGFLSGDIPYVTALPYGHRYVMCTNISYQYYYNKEIRNSVDQHQLDINTGDCQRSLTAMRINGTNLLLVVASPADIMCSELAPLPQKPRTLDIEGIMQEDESVKWRHQRKRRRPTECFDTDKKENYYTCAGCSLSINWILMLTLASFIHFITTV